MTEKIQTHLSIVQNKEANRKRTKAEKIFYDRIWPIVENTAFKTDEKGYLGIISTSAPIDGVSDKTAKKILEILEKKAAASLKLKDISKVKGDLVVYFRKESSLWRLDVCWKDRTAEDFEDWKGKKIFVFETKDIVKGNPYKGKAFYEIAEIFNEEYGECSKETKDIERIIEICRALLYGNLSEQEEKRVINELKKLMLQYRSAVDAIISDFDRDHEENEGWDEDQKGEWV